MTTPGVLAAEQEIRRRRQTLARAELIQRVTARDCAAAKTPTERRRIEAQLGVAREQTRQALAALATAQRELEAILLHVSGP